MNNNKTDMQNPDRKVLVIEDEAGIRNNILLMLKVERYAAIGAENGRTGLDMAKTYLPDLVICDVNMPELDGFGVLEGLRADARFADTPFIFLTAMDDRASLRRGMNLGADDYLTKPFTRDELLAAVNARLKKHQGATRALAERLLTDEAPLTQKFKDRMAGRDTGPAIEEFRPGEVTGRIAEATVLFSDIRNFTTYSERLSGPDIAELLNGYFEQACEPIIRSGGRILKFLGDGIMALFEPSEADKDGTHAERAVRAALGMQLAALSFRDWIERRHAGENLPPFAVGVGIHSGEVLMCHVGAQGHGEMTPIGDTVNIASRLEGQAKELGWAVVASDATVKRAGAGVSVGARQSVQLRGRSMPTLAHEVIGLTSSSASAQTPVQLPDEIREALAANARIAAGAAKAALDVTMRIGNEVTEAFRRKPVNIQGYKLISKIAQGGSSVVHLAQRESDQHKVVLKILTVSAGQDTMSLQRFLQEFDIISAIDHPNVVKIYDRGFSEDRAYIVMEYFSGGTLADAIAAGLSERQAMSLLAQATSALREVHSRGVIHRDIKPANLMAREDGSIALADFGIAKRLGEDFSRTRHGELYGTPYYVSPEQIHGRPATNQSDIYALGLIFYEMLTRERPFQAEGVSELMVQHATAPRPRLPAAQKEYQGLLDRMLAIDPGERFGSADELLDAIDAVWTKHAMRAFQTASR